MRCHLTTAEDLQTAARGGFNDPQLYAEEDSQPKIKIPREEGGCLRQPACTRMPWCPGQRFRSKKKSGHHLISPHPLSWDTLEETEVRESSKVGCGCGQNAGPMSAGSGRLGPGPCHLPVIISGKARVPGELRQAAATCQAPASAPFPLIGHLARAKSQLGVSPVGDLSNESCKAGGG